MHWLIILSGPAFLTSGNECSFLTVYQDKTFATNTNSVKERLSSTVAPKPTNDYACEESFEDAIRDIQQSNDTSIRSNHVKYMYDLIVQSILDLLSSLL